MKKHRKYGIYLYCLTACTIFLLLPACAKKDMTKERTNEESSSQNGGNSTIKREYLKEGFIGDNLFRVIIISTEEECRSGIEDVKDKSKKRAFVTLQKYIISNNVNMKMNTRAELLNLINEYGHFIKPQEECRENNIYYFEIRRDYIKDVIYNISRK